jgi:vacuolar-type H+-ATPase subunit I/STV1
MFFPREMTEVELIIPSKDLVPVTKVLSGRGVFHQVDSAFLGLESLGPSTWQDKAANYSTLERRLQSIMQTLGLTEEQKGSTEFETIVDIESVRPAVDRIEGDVKGVGDQLGVEKKRLESLEAQLKQLEPISHLNFEVGSLRKSDHVHSILGVMKADTKVIERLDSIRVPHVLFELKRDAKDAVVWLLGSKNNSDELERAAKSAFLNPLTLPEEFSGTPEQVVEKTRKAIEESKQKIFELETQLGKLGGVHKTELQKLWWDAHVSRLIADAIARFGQLRHTYVVVGWVPTADMALLTEKLKQASREILIEALPTERSGIMIMCPLHY